mgnify:CR=1 FL=1
MVGKAIVPDYALSSHVAPLGMTFTMNSALPGAYRQGALVGEHGSWNRNTFNGYKVVYIPFDNGAPSGMTQDVVTGFIEGDRAFGRPVGLAIDGTGALIVADDAGNTVWRVAAADGSVTPQPRGTDELVTGSIGETESDAAVAPGFYSDIQDQSSAVEGGKGATATPSDDGLAEAPSGAANREPLSQTEIAPAVLPEETIEVVPAEQQ